MCHMLWTVMNMTLNYQIHVAGGLHYFTYIMSKTEAHVTPYKEGVMLCMSKCEKTRDKDISCVCSLLSETLIWLLAVRFTVL